MQYSGIGDEGWIYMVNFTKWTGWLREREPLCGKGRPGERVVALQRKVAQEQGRDSLRDQICRNNVVITFVHSIYTVHPVPYRLFSLLYAMCTSQLEVSTADGVKRGVSSVGSNCLEELRLRSSRRSF